MTTTTGSAALMTARERPDDTAYFLRIVGVFMVALVAVVILATVITGSPAGIKQTKSAPAPAVVDAAPATSVAPPEITGSSLTQADDTTVAPLPDQQAIGGVSAGYATP